ncbi:MAG: protein mss51 [Oscillospiraceae bacterium]|nr:protein mss51 [Oscillospiraceae bacterium]
MAKCPNCEFNLKPWNIKAECPKCGINIPNYKWEERMEQDAVIAEEAFRKFSITTANFKAGTIGSPFAITRFALALAPLLILLTPIVNIAVNLPFRSGETVKFTFIKLFSFLTGTLDFGSYFKMFSLDGIGAPIKIYTMAYAVLIFCILLAVVNFFTMLICAMRRRFLPNIAICALTALCFAVCIFMVSSAFSQFAASEVSVISGSVGFGLYLGLGLYAVNTVVNILFSSYIKKKKNDAPETVSPDKTDEKQESVAVS